MKLEIKENMYGRTFSGYIVKILNVKEDWIETDTRFIIRTFPQDFVKASYDIMDLVVLNDMLIIEDFVDEACMIFRDAYYIQDEEQILNIKSDLEKNKSKKIYSIITHEQMERMEYKVGE